MFEHVTGARAVDGDVDDVGEAPAITDGVPPLAGTM